MDQQELMRKISQIEEQATDVLAEYPKNLTKERLRMIVALARYIRTELARDSGGISERQGPVVGDAEDTLIPGA